MAEAVAFTILPRSCTASMLMPALVLPTLMLEQISSVRLMASGMERIRASSPAEKPFCTRAL